MILSPIDSVRRSSITSLQCMPETETQRHTTLGPAARRRSLHVRRINQLHLSQRQRGARRRHIWKRQRCADGQLRWVRMYEYKGG